MLNTPTVNRRINHAKREKDYCKRAKTAFYTDAEVVSIRQEIGTEVLKELGFIPTSAVEQLTITSLLYELGRRMEKLQ